MDTKKMFRINVMLDQECVDILEFFARKEMKTSGTVRLAIKVFYENYVKRALDNGEMVIDENGNPSPVDKLLSTPRREAPVDDGEEDDVEIVNDETV